MTALSTSAQGVDFGIRAGLNMSNLTVSPESLSISPKSRTSFNVGVIADWNVAGNFYIQPGLYFSAKGAKEDGETLKASYLQIPILASYHFPVSNIVDIAVDLGPYFAYGIGGKTGENKTFSDKGLLKSFDAGLRFGVGAYITRFYVGVSYELGLANAAHKDIAKDVKIKNSNFSINVGYNF